jgi:hypothetical protein
VLLGSVKPSRDSSRIVFGGAPSSDTLPKKTARRPGRVRSSRPLHAVIPAAKERLRGTGKAYGGHDVQKGTAA